MRLLRKGAQWSFPLVLLLGLGNEIAGVFDGDFSLVTSFAQGALVVVIIQD